MSDNDLVLSSAKPDPGPHAFPKPSCLKQVAPSMTTFSRGDLISLSKRRPFAAESTALLTSGSANVTSLLLQFAMLPASRQQIGPGFWQIVVGMPPPHVDRIACADRA
jgi:hypothetical protein